ncbi:fungal-specific transcription factor domain-containing protein [Lipomyces starkeyi]
MLARSHRIPIMDITHSTQTNPSQQDIDRVIRRKRKPREIKACYPCRQRKVKCDYSQPCTTCLKRGHAEMCLYSPDSNVGDFVGMGNTTVQPGIVARSPQNLDDRKVQNRGLYRMAKSPTATVLQVAPPENFNRNAAILDSEERGSSRAEDITCRSSPSDDNSKRYSYAGSNSTASTVQAQAEGANDSLAHDIEPVLGLSNTYDVYPFMDAKATEDCWNDLSQLSPCQKDILKFFHFYRAFAFPFNPILVDIDRFESDLCTHLDEYATGMLKHRQKMTEPLAIERWAGQISLVLATLASGAQYSDLNLVDRASISQDFARRSFQSLRLANFLFRPSREIVQALLILGNVLQNSGQADAAWAMIGSTARLAQTLGLHSERGMHGLPEKLKEDSRELWSSVIWQDTLLCLCYDRPPVVTRLDVDDRQSLSMKHDLSYAEAMQQVCRLGLVILNSDEAQQHKVTKLMDLLNDVDEICGRTESYLQLKDRPAIRNVRVSSPHDQNELLVFRAKSSLMDATRAFLEFQSLSIVPLRNWSMIHTALISTLLLGIWNETKNDPECLELQRKVIRVLTADEAEATGTNKLPETANGMMLSKTHIRALLALKNALNDISLDVTSAQHMYPAESGEARQVANDAVDGSTTMIRDDLAAGSGSINEDFLRGRLGRPSENTSIGLGLSYDLSDLSPLHVLESVMNNSYYSTDDFFNAVEPEIRTLADTCISVHAMKSFVVETTIC